MEVSDLCSQFNTDCQWNLCSIHQGCHNLHRGLLRITHYCPYHAESSYVAQYVNKSSKLPSTTSCDSPSDDCQINIATSSTRCVYVILHLQYLLVRAWIPEECTSSWAMPDMQEALGNQSQYPNGLSQMQACPRQPVRQPPWR
jgi:hypothetical protein